jgi:hypothetical protein
MQLFLLFIIVFSHQVAFAGLTCDSVIELNTQEIWRTDSNKAFRDNLVGTSPSEKELYFYWHMPSPIELKKVGPFLYRPVLSNSRMRVFRNQLDLDKQSPLEAVNTLFGRQDTSNQTILNEFIANFKSRAEPEAVAAVESVHKLIAKLSNRRQSFGYVATAPAELGGVLLGTFGMFDATAGHSQSSARSPLETSFFLDKVSPEMSEKLAELRKKNPQALIFEMGSFSIHIPDGYPENTKMRVRNLLELFVLRYYVEALPPDTLFIAHASSAELVKRHEERFGLRAIETVRIPGQANPEYILVATGREVGKVLRKTHRLPERGIDILPP